jgi:hypothetical protein
MPLFIVFNTQTMHIKPKIHNSIARFSLKTLYPGGIRTRVCRLSGATPPGLNVSNLLKKKMRAVFYDIYDFLTTAFRQKFSIWKISKLSFHFRLASDVSIQNISKINQSLIIILIDSEKIIIGLCSRVARFFLFQTYQNGKNIPNDQKLYKKAINYTKWQQNIPNGHKIFKHFPLQSPPKITQSGIFGLKINHLATLLCSSCQ